MKFIERDAIFDWFNIITFTVVFLLMLLWPRLAICIECKPRLVSVILKCTADGWCDVRVADGTLGRAKIPVELGVVSEVCQ